VQIQPVNADIADSLGLKAAEGALVAEPQTDSPAVKAGIKSGDVIVSVNDQPVKDARTLAKRISALPPGTSVKLGVISQGTEKTVTVTLGELPQEQRQASRSNNESREGSGATDLPRLGLSLAPAGKVDGAGGEGVVVTQVDPDGPAAAHGFRTGDVILDVGGKRVASPEEVRKAFADARSSGKRTILLRLKSGAGTRFVAVQLGRG